MCNNSKHYDKISFYLEVSRQLDFFQKVGLYVIDSHDPTSWVVDEVSGGIVFIKPHLLVDCRSLWMAHGAVTYVDNDMVVVTKTQPEVMAAGGILLWLAVQSMQDFEQ